MRKKNGRKSPFFTEEETRKLVIGKSGENRQKWGKLKLNVRYVEKINYVDMILFFF